MIRSHHFSAILTAAETLMTQSPAELLGLLRSCVQSAGLNAVGELATLFEPQGVSVVLILEESHVALHIWTETSKIAVDIHVCDYYQDNFDKAKRLTELLAIALTANHKTVHWSYLLATG
ncbi:S-adenosylmethionine decarboxylase [Phormidesmis sp. 146-12]